MATENCTTLFMSNEVAALAANPNTLCFAFYLMLFIPNSTVYKPNKLKAENYKAI